MAFGVAGGIDAIAVELVSGLADNHGAGRPRALTMGVNALVKVDVDRTGGAAAGGGGAGSVIGPLRSHHDVAVAEAHLRMGEPSLGVGDDHLAFEAESLLEPIEGGQGILVVQGRAQAGAAEGIIHSGISLTRNGISSPRENYPPNRPCRARPSGHATRMPVCHSTGSKRAMSLTK